MSMTTPSVSSDGIAASYIANCEQHGTKALGSIVALFAEMDANTAAANNREGQTKAGETPLYILPTALDFSREYIGNVGCCALIMTIRKHFPHLKSLSLRSCGVEEEAAEVLLEAFKDHAYLQELDVSANNLYASGGRALIALLRSNARLHTVKVDMEEMPERVGLAIRKAEKRNYDACFPPLPPPPQVDKYQSRETLDALLKAFLDAEAGGGVDGTAPANSINHTANQTFANVSAISSYPASVAPNNNAVSSSSAPYPTVPSTAVRLMHYWNLRLGAFGVQSLLDKGYSMSTMRTLVAVEKRVRGKEGEGGGGKGNSQKAPPAEASGDGGGEASSPTSRADDRAVPPLCPPSAVVASELDKIGSQLSDPSSLLSQLSKLRDGGVIRMQYETCQRLLERIVKEEKEKEEGAKGQTEETLHSADESTSLNDAILKLMVTLHHLRTAIAGVTLRDFADTVLGVGEGANPRDSRVSYINTIVNGEDDAAAAVNDSSALDSNYENANDQHHQTVHLLAKKCRVFEEAMLDSAAHLSREVYESSRQLSLLCDEMRYFKMNHPAFVEHVTKRLGTITRANTATALSSASPSPLPASTSSSSLPSSPPPLNVAKRVEREDKGGDLTMAAVAFYCQLLGASLSSSSSSSSIASLQAQRVALLNRLSALLPQAMNAFVDELATAKAYQGGVVDLYGDSSSFAPEQGQSSAGGSQNDSAWATVSHFLLPALTASLLYASSTSSSGGSSPVEAIDPYKAFELPALPDRPRPTRAADTFASLEEAIVAGPTGSGAAVPTATSTETPTTTVLGQHSPKPIVIASDPIDVFGAITNKALLMRWFRQYSTYARYEMVLNNGNASE